MRLGYIRFSTHNHNFCLEMTYAEAHYFRIKIIVRKQQHIYVKNGFRYHTKPLYLAVKSISQYLLHTSYLTLGNTPIKLTAK